MMVAFPLFWSLLINAWEISEISALKVGVFEITPRMQSWGNKSVCLGWGSLFGLYRCIYIIHIPLTNLMYDIFAYIYHKN